VEHLEPVVLQVLQELQVLQDRLDHQENQDHRELAVLRVLTVQLQEHVEDGVLLTIILLLQER
jgi:hypothetical protein